jgi:cytoskeletal protein RodZ
MSKIVGQQLRQARQELNLSLERAVEETHIRLHYLEALERGDFAQLPSKAQGRGFLRAYAGYLGLEPISLLNTLDGEANVPILEGIESDQIPVEEERDPPENSVLIFKELGEELRQQREMLGFSLEEVERNIHVRQHYLEALESGDLDGLPSPVQGRGMLQNYAAFLGMDYEPVLLKFADGLQAQLAEKQSSRSRAPKVQSNRARSNTRFLRYFPSDLILGAILILVLVGFVTWGIIRTNSFRSSQAPVETVPSIAEALFETPESDLSEIPIQSETPTPELSETGIPPEVADNPTQAPPEEITPETPIPTDSNAPIQLYVSVLQRAWMRVTVDGDVEFEGRVLPGSAFAFAGEFQIELLTGNGAALQVFFNETDLGVLGVYGEVVYRVFTPGGLLLPTPTITATPTNTPLSSPIPQTETQPSP